MPSNALEPHADEAISTELARANLARLRGDYVLAEELCTALLQKAPHNANVAALMGDVSVEQEKLDAAVQWYELSVDSGAPVGIKEKLASTRERMKLTETEASESGIGLPSRTALSPAMLLGITVIVLMLLVGAFVAGTSRTPSKPPTIDNTPIQIPASTGANIAAQEPTVPPVKADPQKVEAVAPPVEVHQPSVKPDMDSDLAPLIGDATGPLARVTSASADPRSHVVTLDAPLQPGDDPRAVAAQIAEAAMTRLRDAPTFTIRLLNNGKPDYVADASREKYDAYVKSARTAANGAELADALLLNEWKAGSETPATGR